MRAIVIKQYGGPEQLVVTEWPTPVPKPGEVLVEVKAFGLNHAELYFRKGLWGDVAEVSGIECVGIVKSDPDGGVAVGQKVAALMGGMGRSINGSYAEYCCVPATNVVPLESELPWEELAAIPESYATAWSALMGNLEIEPGETLVVRGATSALGQAALNIATRGRARIIATTRDEARAARLKQLGAQEVLAEAPELSRRLRVLHPNGVDAVLDIIGTSTMLDSLAMLHRGGRCCVVGFLGGGEPIAKFDPVFHMPPFGVQLSSFASAFVYGTPDYPLSDIPFQSIVDRVAAGDYKAKPAAVFPFERIADAHRLMEENKAGGKVVVKL
jgi:NADPH:quinone reductase-like Zn-dependent oxidoreductase